MKADSDEEVRFTSQVICRLFLTIVAIAAIVCEGIYGFITAVILIMFYFIVTKG